MGFNFRNVIRNIFHSDENEKAAAENKSVALQQTVNNVFGTTENSTNNTYNPFLKKNGELLNPYLNYNRLLNNPNISQKAKNYISQATGLTTTTSQQKVVTPSTDTTSVSATGSNIANAAQRYIGTPYVWGGESMSEGGMDCSGFVYNALKDAGYDVGRTTAQGYRNYGTSVSKSDMQPGDLIFFGKNNNDASHIGIYLGNGQMIHSSGGSKNTKTNPGKGVSIANVDYRSDFLEARRY